MKGFYEHQSVIVVEDPKKAGIFQGTGSGKTRTTLALARGETLVVCPKTQAEDQNWQRELVKMRADGIKPKLKSLTVYSKETFKKYAPYLKRFETVIGDEAHTLLGVSPNTRRQKGKTIPQTSQTFAEFESYIRRVKPDRIYLPTATIMRSPMTVWGAATILGKKLDFFKFREAFYVRLPMPFREVYSPRSESAVKEKLAKIVHSLGYVGRLEDFFDVPPQIWKTDYVDLTAKQGARIRELPLEYPDPIVCVGKRHQVENGVLAGDEYNEAESFENGKIEKILDYAIEYPRMIVFAKYTAQIEAIRAALEKSKKKVFVMTGATKERGKLLAEANKSKDYAFICQSSISAGWELKQCPVVVFASRSYEWVHFEQAKGRVQRSDNIKVNTYIKLLVRSKNSVDMAIDSSLENKQDFDERLYSKKV